MDYSKEVSIAEAKVSHYAAACRRALSDFILYTDQDHYDKLVLTQDKYWSAVEDLKDLQNKHLNKMLTYHAT